MNLEAVEEMMEKFPDIQILFIESGGDNLSATFSPELVDATIFVIDVAEGDKIPRKGGPGITKSLYQYPLTGRHRCRDRMDQKKCTSGRMLKSDSRE